jgi:hypothetical protein
MTLAMSFGETFVAKYQPAGAALIDKSIYAEVAPKAVVARSRMLPATLQEIWASPSGARLGMLMTGEAHAPEQVFPTSDSATSPRKLTAQRRFSASTDSSRQPTAA